MNFGANYTFYTDWLPKRFFYLRLSSIRDGQSVVWFLAKFLAEDSFWLLSLCVQIWSFLSLRVRLADFIQKKQYFPQAEYSLVDIRPVSDIFFLKGPKLLLGVNKRINLLNC